MSKLVIYLLVLLNFSCFCGKIYTQADLKLQNYEVNVKNGEEFTFQFKANPTYGYYWRLLNKDEVSDSIKFLRSKYVESSIFGQRIKPIGRGGHMFFTFKAIKVTNEAQTLKFTQSRAWPKEHNSPNYIIKVNVN